MVSETDGLTHRKFARVNMERALTFDIKTAHCVFISQQIKKPQMR